MSDVAIRPEQPADVEAIAAVVAAAFGSPAEARLVDAIRASENFIPELSLVADAGDEIVGHVMISHVGLRTSGGLERVASLSPLAVAPAHQRQGIGSALVDAVTDAAEALGEPLVVLEGDPAYYGRLGFEHSVPHGITINLPSWAPPEAAQIKRLRSYESGLQGQVVYPPAFDVVSPEPPPDVPSPIDFRDIGEAREWEASAGERFGRGEILDRIAREAERLTHPGDRVLELGSGPGFLAERLLGRLPEVRYTALDFSSAMHELARARLAPWADRVTFLERSFKSDAWTHGLEPFHLVVTNQAVHELRHKRHAPALHRQVLGVLGPGGSYLVSDHFCDPGGLENTELYMTRDEQMGVLEQAGFASVERVTVAGSLALHVARKGIDAPAAM